MADGHRATRVVKHESEIFPFSDLQMIEDEFNQGRPFGLLVNVENVTRIVQKSYLEIESALSNGIQDLHSTFAVSEKTSNCRYVLCGNMQVKCLDKAIKSTKMYF